MNSFFLRLLDISFAALGLVVGAPIFILVAIVAGLDTGAPLFVQTRVGRDKRHFSLFKFRTMRVGTGDLPTHMTSSASITRSGRYLRRVKLDELPQLWNVLKGDMSLVGPRPCLPSQAELIHERDRLGVYAVRPGVTGLAQLHGVDMSQPRLLAELDAVMVRGLTVRKYLSYVVKTAVGQGAGDPASKVMKTDNQSNGNG